MSARSTVWAVWEGDTLLAIFTEHNFNEAFEFSRSLIEDRDVRVVKQRLPVPATPLEARPHILYRLYGAFDATGEEVLLYVGITGRPLNKRLHEHAADKAWYDKVTRVEETSYPVRYLALAAERTAIADEEPVYNISHNDLGLYAVTSHWTSAWAR